MPGGDGTGPIGMGPMTGRAAGSCRGAAVLEETNIPGGRGLGRGRGRGGRGRRNQFHATGLTGRQRSAAGMQAFGDGQVASPPLTEPEVAPSVDKARELESLKQQAETVEQQLEQLREKIEKRETAN